MPPLPRPPAEMTPDERREEVARLYARGVTRLYRRMLATPGATAPPPPAHPSAAVPSMEFPDQNDWRTPRE